MNSLTILLRIMHVIAGILWAGGAVALYMFIEPAAKETAPDGQKFMGYLMTQRKFSKFLSVTSLLTILGGGALYYRLGNLDWAWVITGPGIGFTIGALSGLLAFAVGFWLVAPRAVKLGELAKEIEIHGGSASTDQTAILSRLQREMYLAGRAEFYLIIIAMLTMSTARYWSF